MEARTNAIECIDNQYEWYVFQDVFFFVELNSRTRFLFGKREDRRFLLGIPLFRFLFYSYLFGSIT